MHLGRERPALTGPWGEQGGMAGRSLTPHLPPSVVATAVPIGTRAAQSAAYCRSSKWQTAKDLRLDEHFRHHVGQSSDFDCGCGQTGGTVLPNFRSPALFPLRLLMTAPKGRQDLVTIDP